MVEEVSIEESNPWLVENKKTTHHVRHSYELSKKHGHHKWSNERTATVKIQSHFRRHKYQKLSKDELEALGQCSFAERMSAEGDYKSAASHSAKAALLYNKTGNSSKETKLHEEAAHYYKSVAQNHEKAKVHATLASRKCRCKDCRECDEMGRLLIEANSHFGDNETQKTKTKRPPLSVANCTAERILFELEASHSKIPPASIVLVLRSCQNLPGADVSGLSDPYVVLSCKDVYGSAQFKFKRHKKNKRRHSSPKKKETESWHFRSSTVLQTCHPIWDPPEYFCFGFSKMESARLAHFHIKVFDCDQGISADDLLCTGTLQFSSTNWISLVSGQMTSIVVSLDIVEEEEEEKSVKNTPRVLFDVILPSAVQSKQNGEGNEMGRRASYDKRKIANQDELDKMATFLQSKNENDNNNEEKVNVVNRIVHSDLERRNIFSVESNSVQKILCACSSFTLFKAEDIICRFGEDDSNVFLLLKGFCTLTKYHPNANKRKCIELSAGATFGDLGGCPLRYQVKAKTSCSCCVLSRKAFQTLFCLQKARQTERILPASALTTTSKDQSMWKNKTNEIWRTNGPNFGKQKLSQVTKLWTSMTNTSNDKNPRLVKREIALDLAKTIFALHLHRDVRSPEDIRSISMTLRKILLKSETFSGREQMLPLGACKALAQTLSLPSSLHLEKEDLGKDDGEILANAGDKATGAFIVLHGEVLMMSPVVDKEENETTDAVKTVSKGSPFRLKKELFTTTTAVEKFKNLREARLNLASKITTTKTTTTGANELVALPGDVIQAKSLVHEGNILKHSHTLWRSPGSVVLFISKNMYEIYFSSIQRELTQAKVDFLENSGIFPNVPRPFLTKLCSLLQEIRYTKGTVLAVQNVTRECGDVVILKDGRVHIYGNISSSSSSVRPNSRAKSHAIFDKHRSKNSSSSSDETVYMNQNKWFAKRHVLEAKPGASLTDAGLSQGKGVHFVKTAISPCTVTAFTNIVVWRISWKEIAKILPPNHRISILQAAELRLHAMQQRVEATSLTKKRMESLGKSRRKNDSKSKTKHVPFSGVAGNENGKEEPQHSVESKHENENENKERRQGHSRGRRPDSVLGEPRRRGAKSTRRSRFPHLDKEQFSVRVAGMKFTAHALRVQAKEEQEAAIRRKVISRKSYFSNRTLEDLQGHSI
eukprot:g1224.t1